MAPVARIDGTPTAHELSVFRDLASLPLMALSQMWIFHGLLISTSLVFSMVHISAGIIAPKRPRSKVMFLFNRTSFQHGLIFPKTGLQKHPDPKTLGIFFAWMACTSSAVGCAAIHWLIFVSLVFALLSISYSYLMLISYRLPSAVWNNDPPKRRQIKSFSHDQPVVGPTSLDPIFHPEQVMACGIFRMLNLV